MNGGGKSVFVRGMIEQLADDHDVTLYTGAGELLERVRRLPVSVTQIPASRVGRLELPGVHAQLPISSAMRTSVTQFLTARRRGICREMTRRHDVLCTQYYLDDVLFSRHLDIPTLYHCHGLVGHGIGERVRKHVSSTDLCLANTEFVATELSRTFGVEPDGVVTPGIDVESFSPAADPAVSPDAPVILFVGRLERQKGVFDLVDAFASLDTDAELYVVGDGSQRVPLQDRVASHGIEDAVSFPGVVPNDDLPGYYAAADVVCHPSHYESLGLANLEAMATGNPLVATRLGPVESYVTHGESGVLVPPKAPDRLARALDRLLDSPTRRRRLADAARDTALEYSWEQQSERFSKLLHAKLVGKSGSDRATAVSTRG